MSCCKHEDQRVQAICADCELDMTAEHIDRAIEELNNRHYLQPGGKPRCCPFGIGCRGEEDRCHLCGVVTCQEHRYHEHTASPRVRWA